MTPGGVDKQIVRDWLAHAEDDALNARSILKHRDGTPAQVCFLAQQMIEKLLKAALVYFRGEVPLTHELPFLAKALSPHLPTIRRDFATELTQISEYYVGTRYPANLPLESFTWQRAEEAFAAAENVRAAIQPALKLDDTLT